ncbi:hypothetical protein ODS41_12655 [Pyrobaculum sp. 3827-6]|uniref:hypothetical protein n=1 Tax=Pyrobaculum sp. 3827-6 TaxID=2983604 RepID=UPI0021DB4B1D|nr:hypothetical protein [Pyrobaculum sp. 3827-6]MCU7788764.1 hypothetical protein [Pyrobaculum sp. 3827-6]
MEELAKYFEDLDEARRIRRERADWSFIQNLPPRQRAALQYYIETGDLYVASRIAGMSMEEFNDLRRRAKIPST